MSIATINPAIGETEKEFEAHDAPEVERRVALANRPTRRPTSRGRSFAP